MNENEKEGRKRVDGMWTDIFLSSHTHTHTQVQPVLDKLVKDFGPGGAL